jgi:hypothetical protein
VEGRRRDILTTLIGAGGAIVAAWGAAWFKPRWSLPWSDLSIDDAPRRKVDDPRNLIGKWEGRFVELEVDARARRTEFKVDGLMRFDNHELLGDMKFTGSLGGAAGDGTLTVRLRWIRRPLILLSFVNTNPERHHYGGCLGVLDGMGHQVHGNYLSYGLDHLTSVASGTFELAKV